MIPGIFETVVGGDSLADRLIRVRDLGFRTVQLHFESVGLEGLPEDVPIRIIEEIRNAVEASGISCSCVDGTFNMIDPDAERRELGAARLRNLLPVAAELGIPLVTLCTGTRDPQNMWRSHPDNQSVDAWRDLSNVLVPLLEEAEATGMQLGIEPEPANVINNAQRARQLIDELGSPALRIIADPANLVAGDMARVPEAVLGEAIELLGERIAVAHAKDLDEAGQFCAAGTGIVPFPSFVERLRESGFDGAIILHSLGVEDIPRAIDTLQNAGVDF